MALSRAHSSTKAADLAKFLLLNRRRVNWNIRSDGDVRWLDPVEYNVDHV